MIETAELGVQVLEALAWPMIALLALFVLRRPITELLSEHPPARLRAGPVELEWERAAVRTARAVASAGVVESKQSSAAQNGGDVPSLVEELAPVAEQAPRVAIEEAYSVLEQALRKALTPTDGPDVQTMRPVGLARLGQRQRRFSDDLVETVEALSVMRNLAVHGRGPEITPERAREYVTLVASALRALRAAGLGLGGSTQRQRAAADQADDSA